MITGREPRLVGGLAGKGKQRLSLRRLGTMLNLLSPDSVALDAVQEMLRSDDFYVRYNAAKLLGKRADRDARLLMEETLKTGEPRTRASVARHLHYFSWFSAEPLMRLALKDSDSRVREGTMYSLCEVGELSAYRLMEEALENEADNVLEAAAYGLRDTQDKAAIPVLRLVLRAEDPDVRIKALEALGMCGIPAAMAVVREAMFDPEPAVKYSATLSLLELAGEGWLDELAGVIGRTSGETLEQVLLGFFHATNYLKIDVAHSKSADLMIDALESALLDESPKVRKAATWSLAWLRHPRAPVILRKIYRIEMDSTVKAHIVRIAASLMSDAGEEILADALTSKDELVQQAAQAVVDERTRTGIVLTYDENAFQGVGFDRADLTGRLR